jgi:lipopolysaccharide export system protein LptC
MAFSKTEGSGIGLYVAREVARLIGAKVNHKPAKKLSDFNLPLLQYYQEIANDNHILSELAKNEYERLKASGTYEYVVNTSMPDVDDKPTKKMVLDELQMPTFQVEFEVII